MSNAREQAWLGRHPDEVRDPLFTHGWEAGRASREAAVKNGRRNADYWRWYAEDLRGEIEAANAKLAAIMVATSDFAFADTEPGESAGYGDGLDYGASIKSAHIRRILTATTPGVSDT